jgi:hypothetical protein
MDSKACAADEAAARGLAQTGLCLHDATQTREHGSAAAGSAIDFSRQALTAATRATAGEGRFLPAARAVYGAAHRRLGNAPRGPAPLPCCGRAE